MAAIPGLLVKVVVSCKTMEKMVLNWVRRDATKIGLLVRPPFFL